MPASAIEPSSTTLIGMSRSVRSVAGAPPAPPLSEPIEPRSDFTIVGIVRISVMMPAIVTAPAPIRRT